MTQPFLYLRHRSTAHSQMAVFKDIDRQLVQVGNDFGTDESTAGMADVTPATNRVIHWQNDLYAVGNHKIWKYDVANSGDWGVFYNFASPVGDTSLTQGLTPVSVDGVPSLVTMYSRGASAGRFVTIDASGIVTESADKTFRTSTFDASTRISCFAPISYRNKIYWTTWLNGIIVQVYDLKTESLTFTASEFGFVNELATNICIHNDKPFLLIGAVNPYPVKLVRMDDNVFTDLGTVVANGAVTQRPGSLFKVGADMVGVFMLSTGGLVAYRIIMNDDNTLNSVSNITTATIPAELRSGGTYAGTSMSVYVRVDTTSNDGVGSPIYEFDVMPNTFAEGNSRRLYRWDGSYTSEWSFVDVGLDVARVSYVVSTEGVGERIWSGSGTLNVSEPTLSLDGTNVNATFKVYGAGQTGVNAQLLFDADGELINTQGTIVSTNQGVLVGNVVTELVADGTSEVTVAWSASVDGVSTGDNPKVAIRVYI